MTKLEAINTMLEAIGEEPVSTLSSGLPEASAAERILDRTRQLVLAKGWHMNTDPNFKLLPDTTTNLIAVPENILRIDSGSKSKYRDVTTREYDGKMCLYDRQKQSFTFTDPVYVDVVWDMDFDVIPFELAYYITIKAAQAFQRSEMSSPALDGFLVDEEAEAWAAVLDWETEHDDSNPLLDTLHGWNISGRRWRWRYPR